jgi:hypothetical protein
MEFVTPAENRGSLRGHGAGFYPQGRVALTAAPPPRCARTFTVPTSAFRR